ncbi:hypothetical protein GXW82_14120 [Streptacidiphilus sp. 4-A2]|nr:hypothetical protein [Streptacidiphilus sp. 4-A2]
MEVLVPEGARTESGAWVNTAYNLGVAWAAGPGGPGRPHRSGLRVRGYAGCSAAARGPGTDRTTAQGKGS